MLKPLVEVRVDAGRLIAEFWDCLRLDPAPVQDLRKKFDAHVRGGGLPTLIVDLNGVTFAGSAALGGFLALHRSAKGSGGRVVFCNVDRNVLEVFRVSKLDPFFTFFANLPDALSGTVGSTAPPASSADDSTPPEAPKPASGTREADERLRRSRGRG